MSAEVDAGVNLRSVTGTVVCLLDQIEVEGGVAALVRGEAVAVFRTHDDHLYALSNYDPCAGASVLARGIVGTRGGVPVVASPMHKQSFDLRTGICLDAPAGSQIAVATYDVGVDAHGVVLVGERRTSGTMGS
ncbi:nitrite reductase small subunit NirD [Nocardioides salsibiostraticola]